MEGPRGLPVSYPGYVLRRHTFSRYLPVKLSSMTHRIAESGLVLEAIQSIVATTELKCRLIYARDEHVSLTLRSSKP